MGDEPPPPGHPDPSLESSTTVADPVEVALAKAVELAAQAGEWATVAELSRELGERRRARMSPAVVSLEATRARRDKRR